MGEDEFYHGFLQCFIFIVYNLPNQQMDIFQESWVILEMNFSEIYFAWTY